MIILESCFLPLGRNLFVGFPSALGRLRDQALFDGLGRDSNVFDFAIDDRLHTLEVRIKGSLGDGGHMSADPALFLGFTTSPDVVAFDRFLSSCFANSCHISSLFLWEGAGN